MLLFYDARCPRTAAMKKANKENCSYEVTSHSELAWVLVFHGKHFVKGSWLSAPICPLNTTEKEQNPDFYPVSPLFALHLAKEQPGERVCR